jgi:hypothetical protein
VGEDSKAILEAVLVVGEFIFIFICFLFVVKTVESSSAPISFRFDGREEALTDNAGFCELCLIMLVSPWQHYTPAAHETF